MSLFERTGAPGRVVARSVHVAREHWVIVSGRLLEPFLFLFSIGVGVGALVDEVAGPDGPIAYRSFVGPALLASSAMNAAVFAGTFDFYGKYKWQQLYDAMLATPLTPRDILIGERRWILLQVAASATAFVVTMAAMGLLESWLALLLVPAALLTAYGFAGAAFFGATFLRSWLDFDLVQLAIIPLFLFSASFFPLDRYPSGLQWAVRCTPLYHGVDLCRDLALGSVGVTSLVSVAYLVALGWIGATLAIGRFAAMAQP